MATRQTFRLAWLNDRSVWPLIGIVGASSLMCTTYFFRNIIRDPAVHWNKEHREQPIIDLYEDEKTTGERIKGYTRHREYFAHHSLKNPVSENHEEALDRGFHSSLVFQIYK